MNEKEVCNIAAGTVIKGSFKSNAHLRLEGNIFGNVKCSGRLVIAPSGSIDGDVECHTLVSEGKVQGNVLSSDLIHLQGTAQLYGDMVCGRLQIDEGATFAGQCTMQIKVAK